MQSEPLNEHLPSDEVERRMNDAMRKALNTPPQPKPSPNPDKGKALRRTVGETLARSERDIKDIRAIIDRLKSHPKETLISSANAQKLGEADKAS